MVQGSCTFRFPLHPFTAGVRPGRADAGPGFLGVPLSAPGSFDDPSYGCVAPWCACPFAPVPSEARIGRADAGSSAIVFSLILVCGFGGPSSTSEGRIGCADARPWDSARPLALFTLLFSSSPNELRHHALPTVCFLHLLRSSGLRHAAPFAPGGVPELDDVLAAYQRRSRPWSGERQGRGPSHMHHCTLIAAVVRAVLDARSVGGSSRRSPPLAFWRVRLAAALGPFPAGARAALDSGC